MKRLLVSLASIGLLSILAAYVTYLVVGPPDRRVLCDPDDLPEHHVCLETVRAWDAASVLWVDARPRNKWERDGVEGSVLVNDQELFGEMEEVFLMEVFGDGGAPKERIVVYCNQSGCSSSTYVADKLREGHAETFGYEVFVLEGGIKALKAEKSDRGSGKKLGEEESSSAVMPWDQAIGMLGSERFLALFGEEGASLLFPVSFFAWD